MLGKSKAAAAGEMAAVRHTGVMGLSWWGRKSEQCWMDMKTVKNLYARGLLAVWANNKETPLHLRCACFHLPIEVLGLFGK